MGETCQKCGCVVALLEPAQLEQFYFLECARLKSYSLFGEILPTYINIFWWNYFCSYYQTQFIVFFMQNVDFSYSECFYCHFNCQITTDLRYLVKFKHEHLAEWSSLCIVPQVIDFIQDDTDGGRHFASSKNFPNFGNFQLPKLAKLHSTCRYTILLSINFMFIWHSIQIYMALINTHSCKDTPKIYF